MAYIFGFKSELARPEYAATPVAPSNYGPDAAAKYVAKKIEELKEDAMSIPVLASLTEIHIIDDQGTEVFHKESRLTASVAGEFFKWIDSEGSAIKYQSIFGFRLKDMIEIGALECLAAYPDIVVPFYWWRQSTSLHDIYEYLLPTDVRKTVGMKNLIHFLTREWVDEKAIYANPRLQATLGLKLLQQAQCVRPAKTVECFDQQGPAQAGPVTPSAMRDAASLVGPGRRG